MTFDKFDKKVSEWIGSVMGLNQHHFVDAPWWDLWDSTNEGEDCTKEAALGCLAQEDIIFAALLTYMGIKHDH